MRSRTYDRAGKAVVRHRRFRGGKPRRWPIHYAHGHASVIACVTYMSSTNPDTSTHAPATHERNIHAALHLPLRGAPESARQKRKRRSKRIRGGPTAQAPYRRQCQTQTLPLQILPVHERGAALWSTAFKPRHPWRQHRTRGRPSRRNVCSICTERRPAGGRKMLRRAAGGSLAAPAPLAGVLLWASENGS